MTHLITAFVFLFMGGVAVLSPQPAMAENAPPLHGEMKRLKLRDTPVELRNMIFTHANGEQKTLKELRGRIVVLNMWATWCPPCVKELPSLNALQYSFDPNYLTVFPVSVDANSDAVTAAYLKDNNLDKLQPFIDKQDQLMQMSELKGAQGIPITLLIDPQGRLLGHFEGDADWAGPDARAVMDYYMNTVSFVPFIID